MCRLLRQCFLSFIQPEIVIEYLFIQCKPFILWKDYVAQSAVLKSENSNQCLV